MSIYNFQNMYPYKLCCIRICSFLNNHPDMKDCMCMSIRRHCIP